MTFAERLKKLLQIRGKRPIDLANESGLNKAIISSYLSGKFIPKQDKLYLISRTLNVNPLYLMGISEELDFPNTTKEKIIADLEKMTPEELKKVSKFIDDFILVKDDEAAG